MGKEKEQIAKTTVPLRHTREEKIGQDLWPKVSKDESKQIGEKTKQNRHTDSPTKRPQMTIETHTNPELRRRRWE